MTALHWRSSAKLPDAGVPGDKIKIYSDKAISRGERYKKSAKGSRFVLVAFRSSRRPCGFFSFCKFSPIATFRAVLLVFGEARSVLDIVGIVLHAHPERAAEAKQFGEFVEQSVYLCPKVARFNKKYESTEEVLKRFNAFVDTLHKIVHWNEKAKGVTTYGITHFADWSWEEFRKVSRSAFDILRPISTMCLRPSTTPAW